MTDAGTGSPIAGLPIVDAQGFWSVGFMSEWALPFAHLLSEIA